MRKIRVRKTLANFSLPDLAWKRVSFLQVFQEDSLFGPTQNENRKQLEVSSTHRHGVHESASYLKVTIFLLNDTKVDS